VDAVIAPQAGATAPAPLAGTLVQVTAETLASLLMVNIIKPSHPVIFGAWPFVSDMRTGAFSGGGGEQALLGAAAGQLGLYYDLPTSTGAGMSDSNSLDIQMGFEKGITSVLAALSGCNAVTEVAGMTATLMGCSFESMVIDNEMLAMIQRAVRGIEVTEETLSFDVIKEISTGPRHFLGHPQTLKFMETEFLYPEFSDRDPTSVWEEKGSVDMTVRAKEVTRNLLSSHYPEYIDPAVDAKIREHYPIRLSKEDMRAECGRW
jgi:trimethylamine--corrinoid protein Co-methyltransferase